MGAAGQRLPRYPRLVPRCVLDGRLQRLLRRLQRLQWLLRRLQRLQRRLLWLLRRRLFGWLYGKLSHDEQLLWRLQRLFDADDERLLWRYADIIL